MKLGMVGLGRMGGNMTERLRRDGHEVETYARTAPERTADSLVELATNCRITIGTALYQAGDRTGLLELRAAVEFCRERGLLALPRPRRNQQSQ